MRMVEAESRARVLLAVAGVSDLRISGRLVLDGDVAPDDYSVSYFWRGVPRVEWRVPDKWQKGVPAPGVTALRSGGVTDDS